MVNLRSADGLDIKSQTRSPDWMVSLSFPYCACNALEGAGELDLDELVSL